MLSRYPISDALRRSLRALFPDPSVPEGLLGGDLSDKDIEFDQLQSEIPGARVLDLKNVLEGYLDQMARELDELGDGEAVRLQSEARGLLLALRELAVRFPEVLLRDEKGVR
jgi:hypothetical protein